MQNVIAGSKVSFEDIKQLANYYHSKRYLIVVDTAGRRMFVTLLRGETAVDVIEGYFHAVILGIAICIIREHPLVRNQNIRRTVCYMSVNNCYYFDRFFS